MAELDVTEILSDPDLVDDIIVIRSVRSVGMNGIVTDTPGTFFTFGSLQPTPASTLRMLPESVRINGFITVVSPFRFVPLTDTTAPDQVIWHNKTYRCRSCEDWTDWGLGMTISVLELTLPTVDVMP